MNKYKLLKQMPRDMKHILFWLI